MTVTRASFITAKPEFAKAGNTQIDAALAAAELETSDTAFGDSRDWAVILKTADMLGASPAGRDARLMLKDTGAATTYGVQLLAMQQAAAVSASRFGSQPPVSEDDE
jgi:hypothetical protein